MGGVDGRPGLVGRERELTQLRAALQETVDGSGRLILLAGETGIGKTRLAEEVANEARERGANVAWGRSWNEEGAPDLWPWMQVVRSCMRAVDEESLGQLVGPHGSELSALVALRGADIDTPQASASPASRFRLFNAIAHFLEACSSRAPLLVILEDLHRADSSSLLLLQFFTQEQRQRPILLIGTHREPDAPPNRALTQTVIEAMREPGSERIMLAGLSAEVCKVLLRSLLGEDVPSDALHALHQRTGGNPLFLTEFARQLRNVGEPGARDWQSAAALPIPAELRELFEQRIESLSGEHRSALLRAAAYGGEFRVGDLVEGTPADDESIVEAALAEAETLGLIRPGAAAGSLRFAQELMREWLSGEIAAPQTTSPSSAGAEATVEMAGPSVFQREGEYWTIAFGGQTCRMKDAKGLAYVALLLRQPHVDVHVSELVHLGSTPAEQAPDSVGADADTTRLGLGDAGAVIDGQAKAAYRTRLEELRAELLEAEGFHDTGRAERARREIDFLTRELASATGMGGRDRRAGSTAERARVNVTRSIVRALTRIDESNPKLGEHLRRAIKTGTFCTYAPDSRPETKWEL